MHAPKRLLRKFSDEAGKSATAEPEALSLSFSGALTVNHDPGCDLQSPEETKSVIQEITSLWPTLETLPSGWSDEWETWPYFFTYFWRSPYFLRLPSLQMIVNIQHQIPGIIEPVMYSTTSESVVAFMVNDVCYVARVAGGSIGLWSLEDLKTDQDIFEFLENNRWKERDPLLPTEQGMATVQRIRDRDPTVTKTLYEEGYLDFEPQPTTEEEEMEDFEQRAMEDDRGEDEAEVDQNLSEIENYLESLEDLNPTPEELHNDPKLEFALKFRDAIKKMKEAEAVAELEEAEQSILDGEDDEYEEDDEEEGDDEDEGGDDRDEDDELKGRLMSEKGMESGEVDTMFLGGKDVAHGNSTAGR
ncbi:hypothetical protein PLEOSDRAFT_1084523 [Pleurotus ostreatus PC15]|uniref:Uncharacterized protein n=1 Tax=Pleurotus ostreatus (strain PC15) TaxID=1137138 RepID=A0A067NFD8_PLEO1|nr:hypothetical protein PLEOSDRAFT_1084523 [Pleurotus ostreatus PC15]